MSASFTLQLELQMNMPYYEWNAADHGSIRTQAGCIASTGMLQRWGVLPTCAGSQASGDPITN